jgi:hypothetical protein
VHIISRKLQHRIVIPFPDRSKKQLIQHLTGAIRLYQNRGFTVTQVHADNEFECTRTHIAPVDLNIVAADSHVGEVERSVRTIKERNRSTVHGLPYKRLPNLLVRELVKHSVTCLNQLPADDGLSDTLSPHTIMTGKPNPDYNDLKLEFGAYVQVFEPTTFSTNTLRSRTTGAVALTHTGNAQGDYYFLSLVSGNRLSRHQWTSLPMTDSAIARVEQLAASENQPWIQSSGLLVEWRPDHPFDDDDDPDYVYTPEVDGDDDSYFFDWDGLTNDYLDDDATVDTNNLSVYDTIDTAPPVPPPMPPLAPAVMPPSTPPSVPRHIAHPCDTSSLDSEFDCILVDTPTTDIQPEATQDTYDTSTIDTRDTATSVPEPHYHLRPSRERSYDHRLAHQMDDPATSKSYTNPTTLLQQSTSRVLTAFVLTQMSAAAGIKIYGQPAVDAILKEFCQLHDKGVFSPHHASSLTHEQRKGSLRAVNLIKEKRTGEIKGRTCADGSVQRDLFSKAETTSPTVSTDALMYTMVIDAKERRDVATADVVGAYLNADMDTFTLMKLTGETVDIMVQVDNKYAEYVSIEKGKPVLYLQLQKALYGCVKSALLWYELFSSTLLDIGFTLNPYDPCVANKTIEEVNVPWCGTLTTTRFHTSIRALCPP